MYMRCFFIFVKKENTPFLSVQPNMEGGGRAVAGSVAYDQGDQVAGDTAARTVWSEMWHQVLHTSDGD